MALITPAVSMESRYHAQGLVAVLPVELVANIFRLLDWPSGLAVSHVCASWRRAALSDPFLWSAYIVPTRGSLGQRARSATCALPALLGRSRPRPFRLYCKGEVPTAVMGLVFENIQHIGALHLGEIGTEDLRRLQEIHAPMLTEFACRWATLPDYVPWAVPSHWAQRMEHLDLRFPCDWPLGCAFSTLRTLSGTMPGGHGFGGPLADYFPNLHRLRMVAVTQETLSNLISLPRSLTSLSVGTRSAGIDCAELLYSWTVPHLHELWLDEVCTTRSVFEALRLFVRTTTGLWGMHVVGNSTILWADPNYRFEIVCGVTGWMAIEPSTISCCGRLCMLRLPLRDFLLFRTNIAPDLVLPALVMARLDVGDEGQLDLASQQDGGRIDTPVLSSIELLARPQFANPSRVVGVVFHTFHAPLPLEALVVRTNGPDEFCRERFSVLRNVVNRVEIHGPTNTVCTSFDMRDEN